MSSRGAKYGIGNLREHLGPTEIVRVVVHIPEVELAGLRDEALRDGFDNLDSWFAWLGRARVLGMFSYTFDSSEPL